MGKGTTNEAQNYAYIDKYPDAGHNYYRLKQVDFGGTFEYSPIQSVLVEQEGEIRIYPTIPSNELTVEFPEDLVEDAIISIYNMQGRLTFEHKLHGSHRQKVVLPQMPAGQYMVHVVNGNQYFRTMIIKQ
jgi:hypothetical protein